MKSGSQDAPAPLTLFYDGSCPLCATEVGYYKRSDTCQALILVDVSSEQFSGDERINRREAMARFHIRRADGRQLSGGLARSAGLALVGETGRPAGCVARSGSVLPYFPEPAPPDRAGFRRISAAIGQIIGEMPMTFYPLKPEG